MFFLKFILKLLKPYMDPISARLKLYWNIYSRILFETLVTIYWVLFVKYFLPFWVKVVIPFKNSSFYKTTKILFKDLFEFIIKTLKPIDDYLEHWIPILCDEFYSLPLEVRQVCSGIFFSYCFLTFFFSKSFQFFWSIFIDILFFLSNLF